MARPRKAGVVARLPDGRFKVRVELADGSHTWRTLKEPTTEARAREIAVAWSERAKREGLAAGAAQPEGETVSSYFERWAESREAQGAHLGLR